MMDDAKKRKEMEMIEERQFWAEIEYEERERKAVIESERRRMLMEHARRLEDFMPYDLLSEEDKENLKKQVNMVIIGHVDAGKSTLMGHLLYKFGVIDASKIHKN